MLPSIEHGRTAVPIEEILMRHLVLLLVLISPLVAAKGLDSMVEELRSGDVSLETIAALVALDRPALRVGYGLCEAAGEPLCKTKASVGYGLCLIAGAPLCKVDGSLGYGLCALSGEKFCKPAGSVGYGMCMLADEANCKP